jgi:hypothetical protein
MMHIDNNDNRILLIIGVCALSLMALLFYA